MKLIIELFKKLLEFPALWVSVIYLFWFVFVPTDESFSTGIWLLGFYLIITALETLLDANQKTSIVLLVVLLPFTWFFSMFVLDLWFSTVGWLGREFIYVPLIILSLSYIAYNLFRAPSSGNKTLHILLFVLTIPILVINITYPITYFPETLDRKDFGNFVYYIVWGMDSDYHSHLTFYKCKEWSIQCEGLYGSYDRMFFDKIIIDKEKNEVSAVDGNFNLGLAFTDGDNPRSYDAFPVQLGDHVYQPSANHEYGGCGAANCDVYIYTAYECNLDYTSCNMIPMQYSATSDRWIYLDVNEATKEIIAYDRDDTPIFTYGEHPVCYVDGCVILAQ